MRVDTVRELAERQGGPLPSGLADGGWRFDGLPRLHRPLRRDVRVAERPGRLPPARRYEFCEDLAATRRALRRGRVLPSNHAARLGGDWFGPIEAVLDGLEAGERDTASRCASPRHRARPRHGGGRARARGRAEVRRPGRGRAERRRKRTRRRRAVRAELPRRRRTPACGRSPTPANGRAPRTSGPRSRTTSPTGSATASRAIDDPRLVERARRPRDPAGGLAAVERRDRRLPLARGPPAPAAPRRRRDRHAELRRPADVRRVARPTCTRRPAGRGRWTTRRSPTSLGPACTRASPTRPRRPSSRPGSTRGSRRTRPSAAAEDRRYGVGMLARCVAASMWHRRLRRLDLTFTIRRLVADRRVAAHRSLLRAASSPLTTFPKIV